MRKVPRNAYVIYGAYGYTGKLITELSVKRGLEPLLLGRDLRKLVPVAEQYGLDFKVINLDQKPELVRILQESELMLNCAGPFSQTARVIASACIESQTHYLDITGEIEIFEWLASMNVRAEEKEVLLLPGVGFDVVPTDCLALFLAEQMPDAAELELAFRAEGGTSPGTSKTMVMNINRGSAVRRDGRIKYVPGGAITEDIDFGHGPELCTCIPWGDVSTAYYSTRIPNITVYTSVSRKSLNLMRLFNFFGWILGSRWFQKLATNWIDKNVSGPSSTRLETGKNYLWGRVTNKAQVKIQAVMTTPQGYKLTALTAVLAVERVLSEIEPRVGFSTPSMAFGKDFIMEVEGVTRVLL